MAVKVTKVTLSQPKTLDIHRNCHRSGEVFVRIAIHLAVGDQTFSQLRVTGLTLSRLVMSSCVMDLLKCLPTLLATKTSSLETFKSSPTFSPPNPPRS